MVNVVVAFPKIEDAKSIRNLLVRHGFHVAAVCTTGAAVINQTDALQSGILVCGYKFPDMLYSHLRDDLPPHFEMLLVASKRLWSEYADNGIVCVDMPIRVNDLINTLEMMAFQLERRRRREKLKPRVRSDEERKTISDAKKLLIERNNMSEEEAHRYLQKASMDSGNSLVETAEMVLSLMG